MTYSEILIQRITALCKRRGITCNKLATMCGLNQSTIDNICRPLLTECLLRRAYCCSACPQEPIRSDSPCRNPTACGSLQRRVPKLLALPQRF